MSNKYKRKEELEDDLSYSQEMEQQAAPAEPEPETAEEASFKKRYGDLRRHMDGLLGKTAADVMTANPTTIASDSMAEEAVAIMNERKITCLFVVDPEAKDGVARGLLHIHDCLRVGLG